ncbi:MAG: YdcF family protein [Oligoflexales bacterium]|nr:YdcF family protein [Oligoflexales bacterium]
MFVVQKIIGLLLSPLSILIISLLLAVTQYKKRPILLYMLLLYLLCIEPTKQLVLYPLESLSYKLEKLGEEEASQANAIVLLGGGVSYHGDWDLPRLSLDALARTYKAKQLYDEFEGDIPIISSAGLPNPELGVPAEGLVLAAVLENMQVYDSVVEQSSRNTFENALLTKEMLEAQGAWFESYPIILVTSALHLPRSIACFEKQGFKVFPKASHYLGSSSFVYSYRSFAPLPRNLLEISQAVHEYIGFAYYKLRGRI